MSTQYWKRCLLCLFVWFIVINNIFTSARRLMYKIVLIIEAGCLAEAAQYFGWAASHLRPRSCTRGRSRCSCSPAASLAPVSALPAYVKPYSTSTTSRLELRRDPVALHCCWGQEDAGSISLRALFGLKTWVLIAIWLEKCRGFFLVSYLGAYRTSQHETLKPMV